MGELPGAGGNFSRGGGGGDLHYLDYSGRFTDGYLCQDSSNRIRQMCAANCLLITHHKSCKT